MASRDGHNTTGDSERVPSWLATTTAWTWRTLILIVGFAALLTVLVRLYLVTLPVVVALILATLCVPPARWLEGRGFPRAAAAGIVVVGGLVAFAGLIAALTPAFIEQVQELRPTVAAAIDQVFAFLDTQFGWDREEIVDVINQGMASLAQQGGQVAGQILSGAAIAIQILASLVLAIVLLFFFVKDGEQIVAWFIARAPDRHTATMRAVSRRSWDALAGFVRGTVLVALIDALGIGIGLWIVGVPLVLPLTVLVFFGSFIPVLGAFLTGLLAVLVALAATNLTTTLIVLAIVIGVQQFEGNVLQPVVMRRAVALHPVVILGALTAGATLIGVIGAFLAVPVAAVLSAASNELRLRHEAAAAGLDQGADPDPLGPEDAPIATDTP